MGLTVRDRVDALLESDPHAVVVGAVRGDTASAVVAGDQRYEADGIVQCLAVVVLFMADSSDSSVRQICDDVAAVAESNQGSPGVVHQGGSNGE